RERDEALVAVEAAAPLVEAVAGSDIATPAAKEAVAEQLAAARAAIPSSEVDEGRAAAVARNTLGNFFLKVVEEVKFAWEQSRSAAYKAGTVTGLATVYGYRDEIIKFVVDNAAQLKVFLEQAFHNPALLRFIDALVEASQNMPTTL